MTDDTKQEIQIVLDLLKGSLTRNGVSMGFVKRIIHWYSLTRIRS